MEERWQKLMDAFHFEKNASTYAQFVKMYGEKHRAYHNLNHIKDCLDQLDAYEHTIEYRDIIELAIWFHDLIYNPYKKDNEIKSGEAAIQFLKKQNADTFTMDLTYELILSTLHIEYPKNGSEALLMDIDISILGRSDNEYEAYTKKIRKEYKWVPFFLYRQKRKEILHKFLERKRLYYTDFYFNKLEERARINITRELQELG
ncbi:MAG: hypothetical protein P1U56_05000 [Saprospiraceae bacterium]|nr:hypothetical protein [Saprospiraceae bacterium]